MTSDQPPHELRGPLGQVIDAGGGIVPALAPMPVPYALSSASPGLATSAGVPPGAPFEDPAGLSLALQQLASQAFPGAGVPTSLSPMSGSVPNALQAPALPLGGVPDLGGPPIAIDAPPNYLPAHAPPELDFSHLELPRDSAAQDDSLARSVRQRGAFDPYAVRRDFPILEERVHGKRLVWLDNAATTQKPLAVIERLREFYTHENSNIHRAAHTLAARATDAYEQGRKTTQQFLNAPSSSEIIFVRGATEGINLIAQSWGRRNIEAGDEIVITHLEHHANIVPWQQLCTATGAKLKVAPVDDRGDVMLEAYERLLGRHTKLVAFPQVSNALGTITPAKEMIAIAHRYGAVVALDGAQAVSHMPVDVQDLDCDFYVFSGHKVFAPTGIGAVFGKSAILDAMPPWQGGGNMIADVTFEKTVYQPPPFRFEAGTGSIADAAGLGTALDYIMAIGMDVIDRYEHELLEYATERLATVPGLTMIGTSPNKAGVLSFVLDGHRTEDIGAALDQDGIAVRSGHHCAQPILRRFGLEATVRASLALYNVSEDVDALVEALHRLQSGAPA